MQPPAASERDETARLVIGLFGPFLIWSVHILAVYSATALVCEARLEWTAETLRLAVLITTAVALLATVLTALATARRSKRHSGTITLATAIAGVAILFVAAPAAWMPPCA